MTIEQIHKAFDTLKTTVSGRAVNKEDEETIEIIFRLLEDMYITQIRIMEAVTEIARKS